MHDYAELGRSRYALLRSFRRDGTPVDTPIWFHLSGPMLVFRTKIGPKTARLTNRPDVEVRACDHRGRVIDGSPSHPGRATILTGARARQADDDLRRRYGWQYDVVPMLPVPGVVYVHRGLRLREKLRRAVTREPWPDSALVRVALGVPGGHWASWSEHA